MKLLAFSLSGRDRGGGVGVLSGAKDGYVSPDLCTFQKLDHGANPWSSSAASATATARCLGAALLYLAPEYLNHSNT